MTCRSLVAGLAAALVVMSLACGNESESGGASPEAEIVLPEPTPVVPGVNAWVVEPVTGDGPPPVVVLVPGGSWAAADPTGLAPLAEELSSAGALVVSVGYRTANESAYFPVPVQDVACATAFAVDQASGGGRDAGEVVIVGHSAGAQLAALVALAPATFTTPECPYPATEPDALIGLAGPYDVTATGGAAANLFGPDRSDPQQWSPGNPLTLADQRPEVPVLLMHGTADTLVPSSFTEQFAAALQDGGHEVSVEYVPDADHATIYSAPVAAPAIIDWLGLADAGSATPSS